MTGKHYLRLTGGRFNNLRVACVLLTQVVFFALPWIWIGGQQALLFDLQHGHFYLFGMLFLPQDAVYLAGLLIFFALGLFGSSAFGGRLWCRFACPQSVYSLIMQWLERAVAGDHVARRKLDAAGGLRRHAVRGTVSLLQILFSLWAGVTLVGYFSPVRDLWGRLWSAGLTGLEFFWIAAYAVFTFMLAAVLREKVCLHMCPYARFQGAMFDRHTYDARRGEPRGKGAAAPGACFDCGICVQVVDKFAPLLGFHEPCRSDSTPLPGGDLPCRDAPGWLAGQQARYPWMPAALLARYARSYGT